CPRTRSSAGGRRRRWSARQHLHVGHRSRTRRRRRRGMVHKVRVELREGGSEIGSVVVGADARTPRDVNVDLRRLHVVAMVPPLDVEAVRDVRVARLVQSRADEPVESAHVMTCHAFLRSILIGVHHCSVTCLLVWSITLCNSHTWPSSSRACSTPKAPRCWVQHWMKRGG